MKISIIALIILLAIGIFADRYIARAIRRQCPGRRWLLWLHKALCAIALVAVVPVLAIDITSSSNEVFVAQMWLMMTYLSITCGQVFFVIFDYISRRLERRFGKSFKWLSRGAAIVAVIGSLAMWWGALYGRYRLEVKPVTVEIAGLPSAFDGYTIAQISDLHVGTYLSDTTYISQVVDRVNSLGADMIVFTGDAINRHSTEFQPFISVLSRLHAPDGVLACRGNHDYAAYYRWSDDWLRWCDSEQQARMMTQAGFDILRNSHRIIRRGNDSIAVIGVEHLSGKPKEHHPYLEQAYPTLADSVTKILLSHNPGHWLGYIADNPDINIALTLSGHTHAMQAEVAGLSPAALFNKAWDGLYSDRDGSHQLYVNRGIGAVGMPSRIGATPQITLITLRPKP